MVFARSNQTHDTNIKINKGELTDLLDGSWSVRRGQLAGHPPVGPHLDDVLEQELDPRGHLRVVDDGPDPLEVLVHPGLGLGVVQQAAAGLEEVGEALDVFHLVFDRLLAPAHLED